MLLIHIENREKREKILTLAKKLNQNVRTFDLDEYSMTLAEVLKGAKPKKKAKPMPLFVMPDVIVFSGFSDKSLDAFLSEYKKAEIPPTPLKAVVTPYNLNMKLEELIGHLKAEALTRG